MNAVRQRADFGSTLRWLLVWLVLPSLPFAVFWIIGGPPRFGPVLMFYGLGIFSSALPFALTAVLYVCATLLDIALLVGHSFNMSLMTVVDSVSYASRLDLLASPMYATLAALLILCPVVALVLLYRWKQRFARISFTTVTLGVLGVCLVDALLQFSPAYSFGRLLRANAPFESAIEASGLESVLAERPDASLLLVMVEGWGQLADPAHAEAVVSPLRTPDIDARYTVRSGDLAYFGSTTNAEIRELCGHWGEYDAFMEEASTDCLPARLGERGVDSVSYHAFTSDMFDRAIWYPNIGFDRSLFAEELLTAGDPVCDGVFAGACDSDVAKDVANALAAADAPVFVYWLTLNSHLPVFPGMPEKHFDCAAGLDPFGNYPVCRIGNLWADVMSDVSRMLLDVDGPPVVALLVGDHQPPYWGRQERGLFDPGRVPWLLLEPN